ncbi:protein arv1-like [Tropilaelaps mercedesae]|uniref:Protein ARV n=1 Tax=Tropilaelaps mercedesae TaxID=418985 RepID=A0A1V9X8X7_9ACAR|nr:protein arv1-like [Tropilaelaps mercedesae]
MRCIHCGTSATELYHVFCGSIKLRECEKCGHFVDDLLEVEPMVIGVKLFLLRREVYRHLCCNRKGPLPLQVPITLLAMEVFLTWTLCCYEENFEETGDSFRWNLFNTTIRAVFGWIAYITVLFVCLATFARREEYCLSRVFYLVTVSSFSKLINIGVVLWSPGECIATAAYATEFYWLLSQCRMLQCTLERSWLAALLCTVVAAWAKWALAASELPCVVANQFVDYV